MKKTVQLLLFAAWLPLGTAFSQHPSGDPLAGAFIPPELVLQMREQIGLSQEQLEAFRARVEKVQTSSNELRERLQRESASLATLVNAERVEETALIAQLDKVLDAERDLKHLHIGLLAATKNLLTPAQQAQLREMAKNRGPGFAEKLGKQLSEKVTKLQAGVQKWIQSGRDPSAIAQAMQQEFKPLIDTGKVAEAEAVLDRLLKQLEEK